MEFRWLVKTNGVTSQQVSAERERTGEPLMVCKARLVKQSKPILQYRLGCACDWRTVPTEFEVVKE